MSAFAVPWYLWILAGLLLVIGEVTTAGSFYLIFFGAGAILVGALSLFGLHLSLALEGLVFVIASVAALLAFRHRLIARFNRNLVPDLAVDSFSTEAVCAKESIPAGGVGKVEFRGTAWNAHNLSEAPIPAGTRCRVERVEGITLYIRPA
jgi:membrane protein implicated in regulation of membrane protease activity